MDFHFESLAQPAGQCTRLQLGLGGSEFLQVLPHLGSQFMRFLRASLPRKQPLQSSFLKLVLSLINGGTRKTKLAGGSRNRVPIMFERAQSLVFELGQIPGIKKLRLLKQRMADLIGARIKGTSGL